MSPKRKSGAASARSQPMGRISATQTSRFRLGGAVQFDAVSVLRVSADANVGHAWWQSVAGCETGPAAPKPGDADIIYGNCKGQFSVSNLRTGQEESDWVGACYMYGHAPNDLPDRFQRVAPIEVSPHDPKVIYHSSQYVYRTTDVGVHWKRISPDLTAQPPVTHHGPWNANANNRGEDGPLAVPRTYEVRLTVGKWSQTRTLKVVEGPRVTAEGVKQADLTEQLELSQQIVDTLSRYVRRTAVRIDTAQQNLADETGPEADKARQQLAELEAAIVTDSNEPSYPQQILIDQIDYLYGMTTNADQKVGRDALTRYAQVHDQLNDAVKKLDNVLDTCGTLCS